MFAVFQLCHNISTDHVTLSQPAPAPKYTFLISHPLVVLAGLQHMHDNVQSKEHHNLEHQPHRTKMNAPPQQADITTDDWAANPLAGQSIVENTQVGITLDSMVQPETRTDGGINNHSRQHH